MNGNWKTRIDQLVSTGMVIVALLVGYFLGRSSNQGNGNATVAVGKAKDKAAVWLIGRRLELDGVDWAKNQRTLVFVLQVGCHFCSESGTFYQRLVQQRSHFGNAQLIAVLPQSPNESRTYLDKMGVTVDDIRQASLSDIGVRGTPTLFLVNGNGIITDAWDGKLAPMGENSVMVRLQIK